MNFPAYDIIKGPIDKDGFDGDVSSNSLQILPADNGYIVNVMEDEEVIETNVYNYKDGVDLVNDLIIRLGLENNLKVNEK